MVPFKLFLYIVVVMYIHQHTLETPKDITIFYFNHHILMNPREKLSVISIQIFTISVALLPFMKFQISLRYHFSSAWITSFTISLKQDFWWRIIFGFSNLIMMYLGVVFLVLTELLEFVNVCVSPNLGSFQPYVFILFCINLFPPLL